MPHRIRQLPAIVVLAAASACCCLAGCRLAKVHTQVSAPRQRFGSLAALHANFSAFSRKSVPPGHFTPASPSAKVSTAFRTWKHGKPLMTPSPWPGTGAFQSGLLFRPLLQAFCRESPWLHPQNLVQPCLKRQSKSGDSVSVHTSPDPFPDANHAGYFFAAFSGRRDQVCPPAMPGISAGRGLPPNFKYEPELPSPEMKWENFSTILVRAHLCLA